MTSTLAQMLALTPDNTSGDVSNADLREMITSLHAGGLAPNAQTVVGSDITGAIGQLYVCTIAGLTANRNITLPSADPGDRIGVYIADGDDTYALILIGAASQTINGGTAATEWSRLFIKGEFVSFVCIAENTWIVDSDKRIPQIVVMQRSSAKTGITESTDTEIDGYATPTVNNASIANATNGRVTPRRSGLYQCLCRSRITAASGAGLGDGSVAIVLFKVDGANSEQRFDQYSIVGASALPIGVASALINLTVGSYISAFVNGTDPTQSTTIQLGSADWNYPKVTVIEVLR